MMLPCKVGSVKVPLRCVAYIFPTKRACGEITGENAFIFAEDEGLMKIAPLIQLFSQGMSEFHRFDENNCIPATNPLDWLKCVQITALKHLFYSFPV